MKNSEVACFQLCLHPWLAGEKVKLWLLSGFRVVAEVRYLIGKSYGTVVRLRLHEVVDVAQEGLHVVARVEDYLICN